MRFLANKLPVALRAGYANDFAQPTLALSEVEGQSRTVESFLEIA